ncbi:MAG: MaoC family dehydratase [Propionibacterium sp.]|nr:MaoC family dehydratase [Propionibacterium sp.]
MPISAEHVGRVYPATKPYRVSRAKIAEFAIALGDDNPAYFDDECPIAPPTFAAVIAAQAWAAIFDDPDLGMALRRTIHADQRFDIVRPLHEGDDVVATLTIEKVRSRGNVDMVTIGVVQATAAGEELGTATSQLIHTREEGVS